MSIQLVMGVSSEASTVPEAELGDSDPAEAVVAARQQGVDLLWLHTNRDLGDFGFTRTPGYVRMRAEEVASGQSLGELAADVIRGYAGLGFKTVAESGGWGGTFAFAVRSPD
jgi:hypothetical protein